MTFDQIMAAVYQQTQVDKAADIAAESACDAGVDVDAQDAWEFLQDLLLESEPELLAQLPDAMPHVFEMEFDRQLGLLRENAAAGL